jgi:hypothetical protein
MAEKIKPSRSCRDRRQEQSFFLKGGSAARATRKA